MLQLVGALLVWLTVALINAYPIDRSETNVDNSTSDLTTMWVVQKQVEVGIILPEFGQFNDRGTFIQQVDEVMRRQSPLWLGQTMYRPRARVIFLSDYSPVKMLTLLCRVLVSNFVNTVIYLADADELKLVSIHYLVGVINNLGVPVLGFTPGLGLAQSKDKDLGRDAETDEMLLQLSPSIMQQAWAIMALLQRYHWHDFNLIVSPLQGATVFVTEINTICEFYRQQMKIKMEIADTVRLASLDFNIVRQRLAVLKHSEVHVIVLYASRSEAATIFKVAKELRLTDPDYMWLLTRTAIGDPATVATYSPDIPVGTLGVTYRMQLSDYKNYLHAALEAWLNAFRHFVPIQHSQNTSFQPEVDGCAAQSAFARWRHGWTMFSTLKQVDFRLKIDLAHVTHMVGMRFGEQGAMNNTVLDVVNLNERRVWKPVGTWNADGIHINEIVWPGGGSHPPNGRPTTYKLNIVTLEEPPYVTYSNPDAVSGRCLSTAAVQVWPGASVDSPSGVNLSTPGSRIKCATGFCIDLLKELAARLRFQFILYEEPQLKWGAVDQFGQWNGIVRQLIDKKADMSVTSLKVNPDRAREIDFSVPFLETGITIALAWQSGIISATAFLKPFDLFTWVIILIVCVQLAAVIIFLFEFYSPVGMDRHRNPFQKYNYSLFTSLWYTWATLFRASVDLMSPRGTAARFYAGLWCLFSLVFLAFYTANLAKFMITHANTYELSGIGDVKLQNPTSTKPSFRFATIPDGNTESYIRQNFYSMYEYMKPFNRPTVLDGLQAVKRGELDAFIYDATVLDYLTDMDDQCQLTTLGRWFAMGSYGIGFPKESRWKPEVNQVLLELSQDGTLERFRSYWFQGTCKMKLKAVRTQNSHPLGIINFTSVFIMLGCGMLLGAVLLLGEHVYFRFVRHRLRRCDRNGCCVLISQNLRTSITIEQTVLNTIRMRAHLKNKVRADSEQIKLKIELQRLRTKNRELEDYIEQMHSTSLSHPLASPLQDSPQKLQAAAPVAAHNPRGQSKPPLLHARPLSHCANYAPTSPPPPRPHSACSALANRNSHPPPLSPVSSRASLATPPRRPRLADRLDGANSTVSTQMSSVDKSRSTTPDSMTMILPKRKRILRRQSPVAINSSRCISAV